MQRKIVNIQTGEETIENLTQEEIDVIVAGQPDPATKALKQQIINSATALFDAMPLGKRALWAGVRQAVLNALIENDFTTAKSIIETLPPIYEGAEVDRNAFLNLFPS